jgi:hypothetical protein
VKDPPAPPLGGKGCFGHVGIFKQPPMCVNCPNGQRFPKSNAPGVLVSLYRSP